jgi:peptidyl-prolyl cis-trans isomerase D
LTRDIAQFVKLALQTRDYDYLKIQIPSILDTSTVSTHEINAYYQQHRATFVTPERVSVDYIRLSLNDIKNTINVSDASIKRYYEDNKLDSKKSFEELKSDIKDQLLSERAQAKYAKKLEQLTDLSYQSPDTLTPVSEALMLPVEHSELFSRLGGEGTLLKNKQVVRASFSHDVLELGNNSEPIQLDNDTVIVLRINQHRPITEKPLTEVHEMIVQKLASIKATKQAMMLGEKLLDTALTPAEKEKLIQDNKLHWEHVKRATRDTDAVLAPINEAAFGLPTINTLTSVSLEDGSYVLVRLSALHDGDLALLDKEQVSSITQQIESNYGMLDYELYVNELMNKARVVRH